MEKKASPVQVSEVRPTPIADVRDIPLDQLPGNADVRLMVNRVMGILEEPSRIQVAMFNSAI